MASQSGGHYVPRLAIALASLVPYILVAAGAVFFRQDVVQDLATSRGDISIVEGLSTAGYAFGALMAGDLINRFQQRHMFLAGQCAFIAGWLLVALAPGVFAYGAGRILAGLATGTLLVTSLPPVMRQFPVERTPLSAAFVNLGLFGAIAAGPLVGGLVASEHGWRFLYGAFCGLGVLNLIVAVIVLPPTEPYNRDLPFDFTGLSLGFLGSVLPFWASGALQSYGFGAPIVAVPLGVGLACFLALMLVEYHKREALSPVEKMWTTLPVVGTLVAMAGGGVFVTLMQLTGQLLLMVEHRSPLEAGLAFWPQVVGAALAAAALGFVFRTRYLPMLAFAGMLLLVAGGALLVLFEPGDSDAHLLTAVGLLGLGAGGTVSPGLFVAGLSLPSQLLGRIFALIELVRSVADFIMSPVVLKVATDASSVPPVSVGGLHFGLWITLSIAVAATILGGAIYVLGGSGLQTPDLQRWLDGKGGAVRSPLLLASLRGD